MHGIECNDMRRGITSQGERMKRAAVVMAVLGLVMGACGMVFAQGDKPAAQTAPSGQAATPPPGKRMPAAKTQPEFDAYNTARQLADPAALEKAADDFAAKYPDSELRVMLYKSAMQKYQQANNADKMMEMARKSLSYDPDDPEALLGVSQVLAERTRDTDLDRDQRLAESRKDAERALVTIDTDVPTSGVPAEQLTAYKGFLRSEAYAILGTLDFNAKNWGQAETNLRKSIDAFPQQVDAVAVFRLAVSLDYQNKIPEAMKYADQAIELTKDRPDSGVGKAARDEKDRLVKLSSGTAPGQSPAQKN
jgi:tetratricopeptide (TPR) repeat protein